MGIVPDMTYALVSSSLALYTAKNPSDSLTLTRHHIKRCQYSGEVENDFMEKLDRFAAFFVEIVREDLINKYKLKNKPNFPSSTFRIR